MSDHRKNQKRDLLFTPAYNGEKTPILTCHGDRLICCNKFRTPRHYTIVKLVSVGSHPTPWSGVAIRVPAIIVVS